MRRTLLVAGQELIVNLRRPGFIIMTLLIPALGLAVLLVASVFGGEVGDFFESQFEPKDAATGYVDHSGVLNAGLPQYSGQFFPYPDEAAARDALLAEEIDSYFVLADDYLKTGKVVVYGVGGGFSTFAAAEGGSLGSFLVDHVVAGKLVH